MALPAVLPFPESVIFVTKLNPITESPKYLVIWRRTEVA